MSNKSDKCNILNIGACIRNIGKIFSKKLIKRAPVVGYNCQTYDYGRKRLTAKRNGLYPLDPPNDLVGTSTGGVNTSIGVPKLDLVLDAGHSIANIEINDHIFISHTDGDHADGLSSVMCESIRREKPFDVYISENAKDYVKSLQRKMSKNDGIKVNFNFVKGGEVLPIDRNTRYEFFDVIHTPTSVGLGVQKRDWMGNWKRVLTYTGDISLREMFEKGLVEKTPALWDTETLVVEASIITPLQKVIPFIDVARARHSSMGDIKNLVEFSRKQGDKKIGQVVVTHILGHPPFIFPCGIIGNDITNRFNDSSLQVSLLSTCSEFGRRISDPKKPHSVLK